MLKRRNYTFALTRDNERVQKIVEKYPKYAYILHDKDKGENHYHYYIEFPNPRSIDSVARELDIPTNMIEQVYNKKAILEYLTHQNDPQKHAYFIEDIITNMNFKQELQPVDLVAEMEDFEKMRAGIITWQEFVMSHNIDCMKLSFMSRVKLYDICSTSQGTQGLSAFRVPCSKPPP